MERQRVRKTLDLWIRVVLVVWFAVGSAAGEPRPLGELREILGQDDGNERRKAAEALGENGSTEAVELLRETYRAEVHDAFGVRAACALALGETGQPGAVSVLEEILGDGDYWVRRQAATALGRLPGDGATGMLETAARDGDPRVRAAAVLALGGREGAGDALLRAHRDPDPEVAAAALESLTASGHPRAMELTERALAEGSWQLRYRAASLLARQEDPRGMQTLAAGAYDGTHPGAALREAAAAGDPAVKTLGALYRGADKRLSARVLDTLEGMPGAAATGFFTDLAGSQGAPPADRVRAATVLFDRHGELTAGQVEEVASLLGSGDANLIAVSLQILLDRGGPGFLPRMVPLVTHESKVVRHFALANLRRHGGPRYEGVFVEALGDANGANVRLALEALGENGSAGALPAIRTLAEQRKYRRYAQAAAEAIEARGR